MKYKKIRFQEIFSFMQNINTECFRVQCFYNKINIFIQIFPEWRPLDLFIVRMQQESLHMDIDSYIRPLAYVSSTPSEIKSLFSYPFQFQIKGKI